MIKLLRIIIFLLLGFTMFYSVGAFGSRFEFPLAIVQTSSFILLFFTIVLYSEEKILSDNEIKEDKFIIPFLIIYAVFSIYIIIQLIPFPTILLKYISPKGYQLFNYVNPESLKLPVSFNEYAYISVYHNATQVELVKNLAYASVTFAVFAFVKDKLLLYWVILLLILIGFLEAGYGIYQYFSGSCKVWWVQMDKSDGITGTYFNRNHFAGMFELVIPVAVTFGFYIIKHFKEKGASYKDILSRGRDQFFFIISGISFIFMSLGLVFSTSRMGLFSFACGILYFLYLLSLKLYRREHRFVYNSIVLFVIMLVLVSLYAGLDPVTERFVSTFKGGKLTDTFRPRMWGDTLYIIKDFWLTGTGLGTYSYIMPQYKDVIFKNYFIDHAHQDILEFISETGLIGFCFLIIFLVLFYKKTFHYFFQAKANLRFILLGINTGITSIIIHSFADYNTKVPGNCVIMAVLFGLWFSIIRIIDAESALDAASDTEVPDNM